MSGARVWRRWTWTLVACALLAVGCQVHLQGPEGRACSASHPCPAPLLCQAGACLEPPLTDDAGVRWQQVRSGFSSTEVGQASTAVVDPTDGNALHTTVQGAPPQAFATGRVDRALLPQSATGRLGGQVTVLSPLDGLTGHVQLLAVLNGAGDTLLSLEFAPQRIVYLQSGAGTLSDAGLAQGPSANNFPALAPLFTPGTVQLELAWVPGQYVRLLVNGTNAFEQPLSGAGSAAAALPSSVVLGLDNEGSSVPDGGFALVFHGWQMSGDPEATFTP